MSHQSELAINIYNSVAEAPHFKAPEFLAAKIAHVNIVRRGTEEGRSTVDLVFVNEIGQHYIVMLTGRLIKNMANFIGEEN